LALAKFMQADLDTYLSLEHPVQQAILSAVSGMTNVPVKDIGIGTDGCGVPVHALPLRQYAFAYARFVDPGDLPATRRQAVARISHAMRDYPYMVAGKDRFCTRLMETSGGDILGKAGAEGVYCVGVESEKYGICVKIDDGNGRAVDGVMLETLKQIQAIPQTVLEELRDYHYKLLKNHAGTVVGEIKPNFTLLQA
jgi:L-asparaginase II